MMTLTCFPKAKLAREKHTAGHASRTLGAILAVGAVVLLAFLFIPHNNIPCPDVLAVHRSENVANRSRLQVKYMRDFKWPVFPYKLCRELPMHETFPAHPPSCESTPRGQLECTYPFTRMAVIVPMTSLDMGIMANALRLWSHPDYMPCDSRKDYRKHIDLIFQHTNSFRDNRAVAKTLMEAMGEARHCFQEVRFLSMNMEPTQDQYPYFGCFSPSPSTMFHSLLGHEEMIKRYSHFFLLEADVRATRPNWLDRVYLETVLDRVDFWHKGSLAYNQLSGNLHLNGNGIFRVGNKDFNCFLERELALKYPLNFDSSIFETMTRPENMEYQHRFIPTTLVMNIAYEFTPGFASDCRENYMLHGRDVAMYYDELRQDYLREFPCPQRVM